MRIVSASFVAILVSSFSLTALAAPPAPTAAAKKKPKKVAVAKTKPPVEVAAPAPPPPPTPTPEPPPAPAAAKDAAPTTAAVTTEAPKPYSVAPLLGYASNQLNLGVGLRGGYTFSQHVYVGGTFVYHLGTSNETTIDGTKLESSVHLFYPGAEVGYDFAVGPVLLRPYAGVGLVVASVSQSNGTHETSDTQASLGIWPGLAASYEMPKVGAFVGADTRVLVSTRGGDPSFGLFATGGLRF